MRPFKFEPAQFVKSKRIFLQLNFLRFMQIQKEKVKGTVVCMSSINRRMMIIGAGWISRRSRAVDVKEMY